MSGETQVLGITDVLTKGSQLEYAVPRKAYERVEGYIDAAALGTAEAVVPRLSSTVMLLRSVSRPSSGSRFAVFMQQRASSMAFVPDAVVFPGGSFDAFDDTSEVPWEGPSPAQWGARMGCNDQTVRRAFVTAAREVFEETGVLLARRLDGGKLSNPMESSELRTAREQLSNHQLAFGRLLQDEGLALWTDLLCPCAHWVTPPSEPRRYNTYFFRALMPDGQFADGKTSEAVRTGWAQPTWLLEQQAEGKLLLMPPTISNLVDLCRFSDSKQACRFKNFVQVFPEPARKQDGALVFRSVVQ